MLDALSNCPRSHKGGGVIFIPKRSVQRAGTQRAHTQDTDPSRVVSLAAEKRVDAESMAT